MNYQLDRKWAFNFHCYAHYPLPSVFLVKIDGQRSQPLFIPRFALSCSGMKDEITLPKYTVRNCKWWGVRLGICPYFIIQKIWNAPWRTKTKSDLTHWAPHNPSSILRNPRNLLEPKTCTSNLTHGGFEQKIGTNPDSHLKVTPVSGIGRLSLFH
jgi:hypothetical protein